MGLFRRRSVPEQVRALALERGERRVAWAVTTEGAPVVATNVGLHLPGRARLDWEQVERAGFAKPVLTVVELSEREGTGRRHVVELDLSTDTDLPETVRTRVAASVAWSSHVRLGGGGVRIVGRRRPGLEVLDWQLVFDRNTDPDDPAVRAQAEQHLEAARRTVG
ncbi:MAG: hypothetical protein LC789_05645 [Actinobacteria bacterium]|nr:hypothetical protein [Actinomycetota bacterium]MCA1719771.1 hypothetical protein [Actinomycetota bacterium]